MLEPINEKTVKAELKKMNKEVKEMVIKNHKLYFKNIRQVFAHMSNRLASVEMGFFHEMISEEQFITLTQQLAWELWVMSKYTQERLLIANDAEDEVVDGMLMTWDYNREKQYWEIKDGEDSIAHILSEDHLNDMMRRIFDGFMSKIEAEKTHFHRHFKLIVEEDEMFPEG